MHGKALRLLMLKALLMLAVGLRAQIRGNNIVVTVEPNHKDWNYQKWTVIF